MIFQNWLNYLSTLLISGRLNAQEMHDDVELNQLCPCIARNSENNYVPAEEENAKILKVYGQENVENLMRLPNSRMITSDQTEFMFFSRSSPENGTRISASVGGFDKSGFDYGKPTVIATHGFLSNGHTEWMKQLKRAQLAALDCNFISIDWSECANNCCYFGARDCAIIVGSYLEELVQVLVANGADPETIHLLGHSLGAHLMSQVSKNGLLIGRITGLDPTKWGFNLGESDRRLDAKDAKFVDVIHSSSVLGWNEVLGQTDFFPNSAGRQPDCSALNTSCSHSMSYLYYIQSLYNGTKYPAKKCDNLSAALAGTCSGDVAYMGVKSIENDRGIFYIRVTEAATGEP